MGCIGYPCLPKLRPKISSPSQYIFSLISLCTCGHTHLQPDKLACAYTLAVGSHLFKLGEIKGRLDG